MTDAVRAQINSSLEAIAATFDAERRRTLEGLNQSVRRMAAAANTTDWKRAVMDAATSYATHVALSYGATPSPAIASALEHRETVIAACVASEFPAEILELLGGAAKAYVFPMAATSAALIAASPEGKLETAALETIALIGGLTLAQVQSRTSPLVGIATPAVSQNGGQQHNEEWKHLDADARALHLRAQRFARVKVAEMQHYHDHAVKAGRKNQRLYDNLKPPIDAARTLYSEQFMKASPRMADYLHEELVRSLANNDEALLGLEYPGPLL